MPRRTKPMPADYWEFPATDAGDSPPLAYLPLRAGAFRRKAVAAGSVASAKWKAAFNSQNIGDLDGVDFALAIFAVTYRMSVHAVLRIDIRKEYLPTIMARRRSTFSTPEAWQKATDFTIERTYENGKTRVEDTFPSFTVPSYDEVRSFVRPALDWQWNDEIDSGGILTPEPYDEAKWTDRYVNPPELAHLYLRVATVASWTDDDHSPDPEDERTTFRIYDGNDVFVKQIVGMANAVQFQQEETLRRKEEHERELAKK